MLQRGTWVLKICSRPVYRLSNCSNCSSFSTSSPRWPRTRIMAGRPSRRAEAVHQLERELHDDPPSTSSKNYQIQRTPGNSSSLIEPKPLDPIDSSYKQPPPPTPPSPPPLKTPRRSAPPGLKPHKQTLFISETIRQTANSHTLITSPLSALEKHQLASAATFFDQHSRFLYSAESLQHHPRNDHVPEVLILGASNVGKSSFLNALIGKPDAARVSARPGKTTLMNAFAVGPPAKLAKGLIPKGEKMPTHSLVVVDTPGYGFKSQATWGDAVLKYIGARKALRGAVLLIPSEKKVSNQDRWLLRSLAQANTRTMVVLTKADKGGGSWIETCSAMATNLRSELKAMERSVKNGWKEGSGWNPDVFVTSAGMDKVPKLGNGGGMGGVRAAILEMAGFNLRDKEIKKQDDAVAYTGAVVSFDDIKWKT